MSKPQQRSVTEGLKQDNLINHSVSAMPLLPQQIAPVDARQADLTARFLANCTNAVMAYFMALRAETDAALAPVFPVAAGKDYPYGRCEEITRDLYERLAKRVRSPEHPFEHVLYNFVAQGGIIRTIWGVLRNQYFQNAIQFGGLYVDVSNDTVFVTKPKVEILPIEECGLVPVRDLAHFRETAQQYWGGEVYANHVLPALAPILPMVSYSPGRLRPGLQSACNYMIDLMCRDGFQQAEEWLREGPSPAPEIAEAILVTTPIDLRPQTPNARNEAIAACRSNRAANYHNDINWRNARILDYLRSVGAPMPAGGGGGRY